jgi:phage protein D
MMSFAASNNVVESTASGADSEDEMSKAQLKKATITVLDGMNKDQVISVLFNPTEYNFERTNSYKATAMPGLGSPLLQFVNGESDHLSMDLFLDDYTDPDGPTSLQQKEKNPVAKRLADISKLLEIDRDLHAPPPVRFNWGPMEFTAVIEKLGRKVTMFHPDGTPARATLSVSFKEYRTLRTRTSGRKSPRPTISMIRARSSRATGCCFLRWRIRMELATLAKNYGDFYSPAYAVRLGASDLVRDLVVAVSQVEVDLMLGAASRFAFTLTDCYSHKLHAFQTGRGDNLLNLLPFGADVEVCLGYGDARSTPTAVRGMITEITTSFPEGGSPELAIAGYDHGFPLTIGKNSRTWSKARDSDAAHEIASFNNLNATIETTNEKHAQIEQNQESDWEFLKKLADRNHFELYVDERRTLHFGKPNDKADAVVRLVYGQGLLNFKPEANLAGQISKVEVYGWNPKTKQPIKGEASAGEESGLSGKSAGQRLNAFVRDPSKRPTLRLRQPVFTQAEADQRAKAALNERAKQFLTGEGETIGLPEVRPDRNVELANLGVPFSKIYYIQQATHKIDNSGYRTRFKVKETGL